MSYTVKVGSNTIDIFNIIQKANNNYAATEYTQLAIFSYNVSNVSNAVEEDLSFGRYKPFYGLKETDGNDIKGYHITNVYKPGVINWSAHRAYVSTSIQDAFKSNNNIQNSESIFDNTWAHHKVYKNTTAITEAFPTGCNKVTIICAGGGGGGGASGRYSTRNSYGSGGGGGGGILLKIGMSLNSKHTGNYEVKAGQAGNGGQVLDSGHGRWDDGNAGGDSYFKLTNQTWIAKGGGGGGGGEITGYTRKEGPPGSGGGVVINYNTGFAETETESWIGNDGTNGYRWNGTTFESVGYMGGAGGYANHNTTNSTHGNHVEIHSQGTNPVINNVDGEDAETGPSGGIYVFGGGGGGSGGNNKSKETNSNGGNGSPGIVIVYFRYD